MKFLDSKEISVEKGNVKVTFKPVTSEHQSALLGYQVNLQNAISANDIGLNVRVQMQTVIYALEIMVNKLFVGGEEYNPKEVALAADPSDEDTFDALKTLYGIVEGLLVKGETKKKSSSRPSRTKKA